MIKVEAAKIHSARQTWKTSTVPKELSDSFCPGSSDVCQNCGSWSFESGLVANTFGQSRCTFGSPSELPGQHATTPVGNVVTVVVVIKSSLDLMMYEYTMSDLSHT